MKILVTGYKGFIGSNMYSKLKELGHEFSIWLVETCNRFGIDFQYSSSASVYGLNNEFKEDSPVDPRTPYAWSKYMFERYVQNKNKWGIKTQGFRYFNVYGIGEDHKGEQASPYHKFSQQIKQFNTINLFQGSENYLRDFVPVEQVLDTHVKFLNVQESGIWNVGTGKPKSFLDVAEELAHTTTKLKFFPMPDNMISSYQKYTCADMSKFEETIKKII